MTAVLIATLGAEPQVVSLATELLLADNQALTQVVVLHTISTRPPLEHALPLLKSTFKAQPDWPPVHNVELAIDDVLTEAALDLFATALFDEIKRWLAMGSAIHLLLAGGRKPMAMIGMSVAQMLLGPADRIWYLFSDDQLRRSGRMTRKVGDKAELIDIPVPQLSPVAPRYTTSFAARTPDEAYSALASAQDQRFIRFFNLELTPAEREVTRLVAQDVLTAGEMALHLHKSPKTINNQLNSVYAKLESAFGILPDRGVKREVLRQMMREHLNTFGH